MEDFYWNSLSRATNVRINDSTHQGGGNVHSSFCIQLSYILHLDSIVRFYKTWTIRCAAHIMLRKHFDASVEDEADSVRASMHAPTMFAFETSQTQQVMQGLFVIHRIYLHLWAIAWPWTSRTFGFHYVEAHGTRDWSKPYGHCEATSWIARIKNH